MLDIHFINEVISEHTADTLREALKEGLKDGDLTPGTRHVIEMALYYLENKEN